METSAPWLNLWLSPSLGDHFADDEFGVFLQIPIDGGGDDHVLIDRADIGLHQGFDPVGNVEFGACDAGTDAPVGVDGGGIGLFG